MKKLVIIFIIIVWALLIINHARAQENYITQVKQWMSEIESLYKAQEKICILGALFRFGNVELTDGKLILYYEPTQETCEISEKGVIIEAEPVKYKENKK